MAAAGTDVEVEGDDEPKVKGAGPAGAGFVSLTAGVFTAAPKENDKGFASCCFS